MSVKGLSPCGRVSFPKLFQPEAMEEGKKPKYQVTLALVPGELDEPGKALFQAMVDAANTCSNDLFGCEYKEVLEIDGEKHVIRSPFHLGKSKPKYYQDNEVFIRFSTYDKPDVVDGLKENITEESGGMYPGAIARVSWTCQAYDHLGNRGVTFYLGNVQKTGKGERFAGGASAQDEFDEVPVEGGDDDTEPF